jgi:hypothetical protein
MDQEYTRREFYDLVWSQPMRTIAAGFGISDVALAKHCKKANIPVPERGYWARKQAGKAVVQVALPPRFFGASDRIGSSDRHHSYGSDWAETFAKMAIPEMPVFEEEMDTVRQRAVKAVGKVRFQKTFDPAHPLVARLLEHDDKRRQEAIKWPSSYFRPRYETGAERRRLLIVNTLFLAFVRLGCRPSMSTSKYQDEQSGRQLSIQIGEELVYFSIEAVSSRKEGQREPLRLALGVVDRREPSKVFWEDGAGAPLEQQFATISAELLVTAEASYRRTLVSRRAWIIERKAAAEKELRERREKAEREARLLAEKRERDRIARLLGQAEALDQADRIRAYVSRVLSRAGEMAISPSELERWAAWAMRQADNLDPVKNGSIARSIDADGDLPDGAHRQQCW